MSNFETNVPGAATPRRFKKVIFVQIQNVINLKDNTIISDFTWNSQSISADDSSYEGGAK